MPLRRPILPCVVWILRWRSCRRLLGDDAPSENDRQRRPEREREDRTREQEAKTHAAAHVTRAIGARVNLRYTVMSRACGVS